MVYKYDNILVTNTRNSIYESMILLIIGQ